MNLRKHARNSIESVIAFAVATLVFAVLSLGHRDVFSAPGIVESFVVTAVLFTGPFQIGMGTTRRFLRGRASFAVGAIASWMVGVVTMVILHLTFNEMTIAVVTEPEMIYAIALLAVYSSLYLGIRYFDEVLSFRQRWANAE